MIDWKNICTGSVPYKGYNPYFIVVRTPIRMITVCQKIKKIIFIFCKK